MVDETGERCWEAQLPNTSNLGKKWSCADIGQDSEGSVLATGRKTEDADENSQALVFVAKYGRPSCD